MVEKFQLTKEVFRLDIADIISEYIIFLSKHKEKINQEFNENYDRLIKEYNNVLFYEEEDDLIRCKQIQEESLRFLFRFEVLYE